MPAKPVPGLGLVLGVIVGYAAIVGGSYASTRLATARAVRLESDLGRSMPWLALLVAVALVLGVLMSIPAIGSGVMVGTGGLMTLAGLAFLVLPLRQVFDLSKAFRVPGSRFPPSYMLFDGSLLFLGLVLLLVGARRWASDAKVYRTLTGRTQGQTFPQQQQWGGYSGRQQQPQYGGYPGQQQPQDYREQPPGGQQPPR
ncbi:hypothetical protein E1218_24530 [Kribbella turkmenica]|uniref:Uncharacterized protein n=1 Tax=Kribbella turkmenica TaxID=2530375 RepID=A0A4R4WN94_9ACTN|nr:hypothetical protein [Kribbella turkmenica]TDD19227.1 hypothetical protein E1218_24530 [Kribbella turkmenica]